MITNLVASIIIALVTNVSERVPMTADQVPCPDGVKNGYSCAALHFGPYYAVPNPTNKWIRTIIVRRKELAFEFEGRQYTAIIAEEKLSDKEVELSLIKTEEWKLKE